MHDLKPTKKRFLIKKTKQKYLEFKIKNILLPRAVYSCNFNPKFALKTNETESVQ